MSLNSRSYRHLKARRYPLVNPFRAWRTYQLMLDTAGLGLADYPIRLRVTDEHGAFDSSLDQQFTVRIVDSTTNRPPRFEFPPYPTEVAYVGQVYHFDAHAWDPDGDPVQYGIDRGQSTLPTGNDFRVDVDYGIATWTPTDDDVDQEFTVTLVARDVPPNPVDQKSDSFTYAIRVIQGNADPYFTTRPYAVDANNQPIVVNNDSGVPLVEHFIPQEAIGNADPNVVHLRDDDGDEVVEFNKLLSNGELTSVRLNVGVPQDSANADVVFVIDRTHGGGMVADFVERLSLPPNDAQNALYTLDAALDQKFTGSVRYGITVFEGIDRHDSTPTPDADVLCFDPSSGTPLETPLENVCGESATATAEFTDNVDHIRNMFGAIHDQPFWANSALSQEGYDPYKGVLAAVGADYGYRADAEHIVVLVSATSRCILSDTDPNASNYAPCNSANPNDDLSAVADALGAADARLIAISPTPNRVPFDALPEDPADLGLNATLFDKKAGTWTIADGTFYGSDSEVAISLFRPPTIVPADHDPYRILYSVDVLLEPNFNAMMVFDYQGSDDFRFAGLRTGNDDFGDMPIELVSGHVSGDTWTVEESVAYSQPNGILTSGTEVRLNAEFSSDYYSRGNLKLSLSDNPDLANVTISPCTGGCPNFLPGRTGLATTSAEFVYPPEIPSTIPDSSGAAAAAFSDYLMGVYEDDGHTSPIGTGGPDSAFDHVYGIWEVFEGPRAIGTSRSGDNAIAFVPYIEMESVPDVGPTGESYSVTVLPDGTFDGFGRLLDTAYSGAGPIADEFNAPIVSSNNVGILYPPINNELVPITRSQNNPVGATFDLELLVNDSEHNLYLQSFAKAFASFVGEPADINIESTEVASPDDVTYIGSSFVGDDGNGSSEFDLFFAGRGEIRTYDLNVFNNGNLLGAIPVAIGSPYEYRMRAADPDGDTPLSFEVTAPSDLNIEVSDQDATDDFVNNVLRYFPDTPDNGREFTAVTRDGFGGRDRQTWEVKAREYDDGTSSNTPPTISVPNASVALGSTLSYEVDASDMDDDPLQYFLLANPAPPTGMRIDRYSGVITWTPDQNQYGGTLNLAVRVTDGIEAVEGGFDVEVVDPYTNNIPPVLHDIGSVYMSRDGFVEFSVTADNDDNDLLTFAVGGAANAVVDVVGNSAEIRWDASQIDYFYLNQFRITVTVTDGRGGIDQQSILVDGYRPNVPPVFITEEFLGILEDGRDVYAPIRAIDPYNPAEADNAILPYPIPVELTDDIVTVYDNGSATSTSLSDIGLGFTELDDNTWAISGTPNLSDFSAPSAVEISVVARDSVLPPDDLQNFSFEDGATTLRIFKYDVGTGGSHDPELTSQPSPYAPAGRLFEYRIDVSDDDGDFVNIDASPLINAMNSGDNILDASYDAGTRIISWIPSNSRIGDSLTGLSINLDATVVGLPDITITGYQQNHAPRISPIQPPDAVLSREYRLPLVANDQDKQVLTWRIIDSTTVGMVIDYESGEFVWTPNVRDLLNDGIQRVTVEVADGSGLRAELPLTIKVRATNMPPMVSTFNPPATLVHNSVTDYFVEIFDVDEGPGPLSISFEDELHSPIDWITESAGTIRFDTSNVQIGTTQTVTLVATDGAPSIDLRLTFTVEVVDQGAPSRPQFVNSPPLKVLTGQGTIDFHDTRILDTSELVLVPPNPPGLVLINGVLSWNTNDTGLVPGQTEHITLKNGTDPAATIQRTPVLVVNGSGQMNAGPIIAGADVPESFHYDVSPGDYFQVNLIASDPDNDLILFESEGTPDWISVDRFGRVFGTVPEDADVNDEWNFSVAAKDEYGMFATGMPSPGNANFELTAVAAAAPQVILTAFQDFHSEARLTARDHIDIHRRSRVEFVTAPTDPDRLIDMHFEILMPNGVIFEREASATFSVNHPFDDVGTYVVTAVATYEDWPQSIVSNQIEVSVHDETGRRPILEIYADDLPGVPTIISAPTDLHFTVQFPDTLLNTDRWQLELVPQGSGDPILLEEGRGNQVNGLTTLSPILYPEGAYELVLTANGLLPPTARFVATLTVDTFLENVTDSFDADNPIGNFGISFTDLSIPVGGIPISIERSYDTAKIHEHGEFGPGWQLDFRQAQVRTYGLGLFDDQFPGESSFVQDQTLVRIGLPGRDQSEVFLFTVQVVSNHPANVMFKPAFIQRPGTSSTLSVEAHPTFPSPGGDIRLSISNLHGGLVHAAHPLIPYHPVNLRQYYVLRTADGFEYRIDSETGLIDRIDEPSGKYLNLTGGDQIAAYSPNTTGGFERISEVTLVRENGIIKEIVDPDGNRIVYDHDPETADLVSVTNREGETTTLAYNSIDGMPVNTPPHYLSEIENSRGERVLKIEYRGNDYKLEGITDARGNSAAFSYSLDVTDYPGFTIETIIDPELNVAHIVRNPQGDVDRTITEKEDDSYVTVYTYDDMDFQTGQSKPIFAAGTSGQPPTPETLLDLGDSEPVESEPSHWQSRREYSELGLVLSETNAGLTTSYFDHDLLGTPRRIVDPSGTETVNQLWYGTQPGRIPGQLDRVRVQGADGDQLSSTKFDYESLTGNLIAVWQEGTDGTLIKSSTTIYTDDGLVDRVSGPLNDDGQAPWTYFRYDTNRNQVMTYNHWEDPKDADDDFDKTFATWTEYDREGRVVRTTQYELDGFEFPVDEAQLIADAVELWSTSTLYNSVGLVESSADRFDNITTNRYDKTGNLVETRTPVHSDIDGGTEYLLVTRTAYDDNGRAFATAESFLMNSAGSQRVTPSADLRLNLTEYDELGRVATTCRLPGFEITITASPAGDEMTYEASLDPAPSCSDASVLASTTTDYDDLGLVRQSETMRLTTSGAETHKTWFAYDTNQQQTHTIQFIDLDQDGHSTSGVVFDGDGFPIIDLADPSSWPDEAIITETVYDGAGRQQRSYDPLRHITQFDYDGLGRATTIESVGDAAGIPLIIANHSAYDDFGRRVSATDPVGQTTRYEYDKTGRLTAVTLPGASASYEYTYDVNGNQTSITDPLNRVTTFSYDDQGRQRSRTLPLGNISGAGFEERMEYIGSNQSTGVDSDGVKFGQLEYQVDFEGQVTASRYDNTATGGGRLVGTFYYDSETAYEQDRDDGSNDLNAALESIRYEYDAYGRQAKTIFTQSAVYTTTNHYDGEGRLIGVDSEEGYVGYDYDPSGRLERTYTGDSANPHTATEYGYDVLGRLITVNAAARNGASVSNETTTYFYDKVGNLDKTVHSVPDVTTDYVYDPFHRLTEVNHATAAGQPIASFAYTLRDDGKRVKEQRSDDNGAVLSTFDWVYDEFGRLIGEAYDNMDDDSLDFLNFYEFDEVGNRIGKSSLEGTGVEVQIDAFVSDPTSIDYQGEVVEYYYDANDRLIRQKDWIEMTTTFFGYGEDVSFTSPNLDGGDGTQQTLKVQYDGTHDYEPTSATPERTETYGFNRQGRQSTLDITDETGTVVTDLDYRYNAHGIRVEVHDADSGDTTLYLVDANNPTGYAQVLEEGVDDGGTSGQLDPVEVDRSYTIGHDVISQADGGASTPQFLLYDGHGSTRALLNEMGDVLQNPAANNLEQIFDYDAFGNLLNIEADQAVTSLLYSGEFTDVATGQQYLRARYYDPANGRFNRLDPLLTPDASVPQSLHKYTYGHNDPIQNIDPTGLFSMVGTLGATGFGNLMNSVTGFTGELVLNSLEAKRFSWEMIAFAGGLFAFGGIVSGVSDEILEQFSFARDWFAKNSWPAGLLAQLYVPQNISRIVLRHEWGCRCLMDELHII